MPSAPAPSPAIRLAGFALSLAAALSAQNIPAIPDGPEIPAQPAPAPAPSPTAGSRSGQAAPARSAPAAPQVKPITRAADLPGDPVFRPGRSQPLKVGAIMEVIDGNKLPRLLLTGPGDIQFISDPPSDWAYRRTPPTPEATFDLIGFSGETLTFSTYPLETLFPEPTQEYLTRYAKGLLSRPPAGWSVSILTDLQTPPDRRQPSILGAVPLLLDSRFENRETAAVFLRREWFILVRERWLVVTLNVAESRFPQAVRSVSGLLTYLNDVTPPSP